MDRLPLVCSRMAATANEYCDFIDNFHRLEKDRSWVLRMTKLLPRLHIAVIALAPTTDWYRPYQFPDDDKRCELFMRLHRVLQTDKTLNEAYGQSTLWQQFCDQFADDFTDIYFDLRQGLETLSVDPVKATNRWLCSFYMHWGQHLLDAECRLHAVEAREKPLSLTGWSWPAYSPAQAC